MNSILKNTLTVAALMTASTAAFAETMTAKVDFPFEAAGSHYPAANYRIDLIRSYSGAHIMSVTAMGRKISNLLLPRAEYIAAGGTPKLSFRCSDDLGCHLQKVEFGASESWEVRSREVSRKQLERMALVTLPQTKVR